MAKLPVTTWTPEFVNTDHSFFDIGEHEQREFTDISELLIDRIQSGDIDPKEALTENEAIRVTAFQPMKFDRPKSMLDDYIYEIGEQDGMGDPDGDHESLGKEEYAELEALEKALIDRLCELYKPWGNEPAAIVVVPFAEWWAHLTDEERVGLE
jgi:hypothetical protein